MKTRKVVLFHTYIQCLFTQRKWHSVTENKLFKGWCLGKESWYMRFTQRLWRPETLERGHSIAVVNNEQQNLLIQFQGEFIYIQTVIL